MSVWKTQKQNQTLRKLQSFSSCILIINYIIPISGTPGVHDFVLKEFNAKSIKIKTFWLHQSQQTPDLTLRTKCYWSEEGQRSRIRRINPKPSNISLFFPTCSHLNVMYLGCRRRSCFSSSPWQQKNNCRVSGDACCSGLVILHHSVSIPFLLIDGLSINRWVVSVNVSAN